jgi:hypothetical protein
MRQSLLGEWRRSKDGAAALLLAPECVESEEQRAGLIAAAVRLREPEITAIEGVVGIADVVSDGPRIWVLADRPLLPSVAELLAAPLDGGCAETVLRDVATALIALHEHDVVHGGVATLTVVVDERGQSALIETALAPALMSRAASTASDAEAWAALAETLGAAWSVSDSGTLRRLAAAAAAARTDGLAVAVERLSSDDAARTRLGSAVAAMLATPAVTAPADPKATRLATAADAVPAPPPGPTPPAAGDPAATMLGTRSRSASATPAARTGGPLRFGPGVHSSGAPAGLAALDLAVARRGASAERARKRRSRRRIALTLLVLALVGGYLLWRSSIALSVQDVRVVATVPPGCGHTVDFAATVDVGGAGELHYQWLRSDGTKSAVGTESVWPWQGTLHLHLYWAFSGPGSFRAMAELKVWGAQHASARAAATYRCPAR